MIKKLVSSIIFSAILMAVFATPVHATSGTSNSEASSAVISCVKTAVSSREATLSAGYTTLSTAISAAYSTRSTALNQAWSLGSWNLVKPAVKAAWAAFKTSKKAASKDWQNTRRTAWAKFKTDTKACKASTDVTGTEKVSDEASGE